MIQIEQRKTSSIIAMVILVVLIIMLVYGVFQNPYGRITALALPVLLAAIVLLRDFGDYIPMIPRGMQVNFDSGIAGTLRGALIHHTGGLVTGMISIEKTLVPEDIVKERRVGNFQFLDWITAGNVTIYVTGMEYQWVDIPSSQTDNRHGAMRFVGNIKGEELPESYDKPLTVKLRNLTTANQYALSAMQWIEHQTANIATKQLLDMDAASQLLREIADRAKNVRIVTKRGGGGDEAMAQEMSSN